MVKTSISETYKYGVDDRDVMSSNPGWVEPWVHNTSKSYLNDNYENQSIRIAFKQKLEAGRKWIKVEGQKLPLCL